jgi:hypothetical protein
MTGNGKGFEIILNAAQKMLQVRAWGEWDQGLAQKFHYALREKSEDLEANGQGWYAMIDLTEFSAQSQDVWNAIVVHLKNTQSPGLKRIAYVQPEQPGRFLREKHDIGGQFQTADAALRWLLDTATRHEQGGIDHV